MGNKQPTEILEATKNAPFTLNKLSEDFISIETTFNATTKKLQDEKNEIETSHNKALSFLQNQHKQKINDKENLFSNERLL